jgi:RAD51-like protein 2
MTVDPHSIVEGIHLIRVATQVQMIALLQTLDDWLESHSKVGGRSVDPPFANKVDRTRLQVRLVVIDTLSFHFRQPNLDMNSRRRVMDT